MSKKYVEEDYDDIDEDSDAEVEEEDEFKDLAASVNAKFKVNSLDDKRLQKIREDQQRRLQQMRESMRAEMEDEDEEDEQKQTTKDRFKYLLKQTEIFSFSMAANRTANTNSQPKQIKGKHHIASSVSETAEDEEILREAVEDNKVEYTRLNASPKYINGQLRNYQIEGLNWLIRLHESGVNGILADEMGLGKTLQTISFLGFLKFNKNIRGPHMVIVPKSVIPNWINEFKKWCPEMTAIKFHGTKEDRQKIKKEILFTGKFDVCVTSFEMAIKEKAALSKFNWRYLIIDEAHRIKNENSVLSQCVRIFKTQFRLLITGTPLQNNLHELWALLNFLLPELFDNAEDFDSWFNLKEGQAQTEVISQLHKVLKPFMLRRLKTDVENGIPPKKEIYVECGMSSMQRQWYRQLLTKDVAVLKGGEKLKLLNIVMQLRKCCNHPYLFDGAEPGPPFTLDSHLIHNSGKMVLLDKLLAKLKEQGSRVLIFSQMTRMLDILEDFCFFRNYQYCRIDGQTSTEDRESSLEAYNKEGSEKFIFLLSTRAGGLGINLATADTCIIYDSDWNPQADLQAQDRCHRIGQKKSVRVFRFITKDSIEEKIYQRAVKKLYLDAAVIQQGRLVDQNSKMNKAELLAMIKFGAEEIFRSTESTITDEEIDAILLRGEKKQQEIDNEYKAKFTQNNLMNFSLAEDANLYEFEGLDYSQKPTKSVVINPIPADLTDENLLQKLGELEKSVDDVIVSQEKSSAILYFRNKNAANSVLDFLNNQGFKAKFCKRSDVFIQQLEEYATIANPERRAARLRSGTVSEYSEREYVKNIGIKQPKYADFQFLNQEKLLEIWRKENQFAVQQHLKRKKRQQERKKAEAVAKAENEETAENDDKISNVDAMEDDSSDEEDGTGLAEEEQQEKEELLKQGFINWTKRDFLNFVKGCETYGREDITNVASVVEGKSVDEVKRYSEVFWSRFSEVADHERYIKRIKKGEEVLQKIDKYNKLLQWKTKKYANPWSEVKFNYGQNKGKQYTEEEDRFLVCMGAKLGYTNIVAIRTEVRKAWQFRFDWFLKTRSPQELQRRLESLVKIINKEYIDENNGEDIVKTEGEPKQRKPRGKRKAAAIEGSSNNAGEGSSNSAADTTNDKVANDKSTEGAKSNKRQRRK